MDDSLLDIAGLQMVLKTVRGDVRAIDDVNIKVKKGELVGIVGESGSGKTMTALSVMRFVPSISKMLGGRINFCGEDLLQLTDAQMQKIRGKRISMIFQDPMTYLNPMMKIGHQVGEVFIKHEGLRKKKAWSKAVEALSLVGIASPTDVASQYPHQLSGGMRQRVLIAMAVSCSPELLIADEPTTALDVTIQAQIIELIKSIKEKKNISLLLITHDFGLIAHLCDRVYVMYAGTILEEADVNTIFHDCMHPYTRKLLESVMYQQQAGNMVSFIEGSIPDLANLPKGCRFHPRCPQAMDICREKEPPKKEFSENHSAKCWLYN